MKKMLAFLLAALVLMSMTACQPSNTGAAKNDPDEMGMEMGQTYSDYEGISVQIERACWNGNDFVLDINWINKTTHEAVFGASYIIERKEGEKWVSCATTDELTFVSIAYLLDAGQIRKETYRVSQMFDVTKAGTYRFRSDFSVSEGSYQTVWAEFSLSSNHEVDPAQTQDPVDFDVQYIRTDGYRDGEKYPKVVFIRSVEALNGYYEANKDTFDLSRKDKVYSDTTTGFLDACDRYDAAYFEKGYLVFVLLEEGSGSIRHKVTGSTISSDGKLGIYIDTISPEVGTCDMAEWHIILEMSNGIKVKDENSVQVYLNGRLSFDEGAAVTLEADTQTQSPVVLKEPPAAKMLYQNGSVPLLTAGCSWMYPGGDGATQGIIADHAHPLECKDLLKPIKVKGHYGKLAFEDEPDQVEIRCWPDTQWNQSDSAAEKIICQGSTFDLKEGGFIYEITARWNDSELKHYGTVTYCIYIISNKE